MSRYEDEDGIDDDYDDYDDGYAACGRCDGNGEIMVCPDDGCRGAGECFHGDGVVMCPACGGTGEQEIAKQA